MQQIPKIIHLCWVGDDPYPEKISHCIKSWQDIMPDYTIMLWDSDKLKDINNRFAQEAYKERKWAFVSDYIRLYALYNYGGIYLDSDVKVYKRFDKFLEYGFFSCIEYFKPTNYIAIEAAVMGSRKNHSFIKECLDLYKDIPFIKHDGSLDQTTITVKMAEVANKNWGFLYENKMQKLRNDMVIYPAVTFTNTSGEFSHKMTYAIHLCNGSWLEKKPTFVERIIAFTCRYYKSPHIAIENIYKKIKSRLFR